MRPGQIELSSLIFGHELPEGSGTRTLADRFLRQPPAAQPPAREEPSQEAMDSLLDTSSIGKASDQEGRERMASWIDPAPAAPAARPLPPAPPPPRVPAHVPSFVPTIVTLAQQLREELAHGIHSLLSLNPSRREALARHLAWLAGEPAPATASADTLRRWIEGPRSQAQSDALRAYLEEIALVWLGQAIVLKAWSDKGVRPWSPGDLKHLNWALSHSLKPLVPLHREGWQITRPNLYSWYNPPAALQNEIWTALGNWRLENEGPELLATALRYSRQAQPPWPELKSYDPRFFASVWERTRSLIPARGTAQSARRTAFSPTLRDGTLIRALSQAWAGAARTSTGEALPSVEWVGLEAYPFQLMVCELSQLWGGPTPPPLWSVGSGLEVHGREQLSLSWSSPKPSLESQISEQEACDLAFLLEERSIRPQGRGPDAARFRATLDALPYFRPLRGPETTVGALQACVAASKLRPGGLLWWAREEALSGREGDAVIHFLLDRARLLCQWDLSALHHALPSAVPLFPKHLYLFRREADAETRRENRPLSVTIRGTIRSHVEVPLFLHDALACLDGEPPTREQWNLHVMKSPTPQQDWAERWPDPAAADMISRFERLKQGSFPLGQLAIVRSIQAAPVAPGTPGPGAGSKGKSFGLWLDASIDAPGAALRVERLVPGSPDAKGGFAVLLPEEGWAAPMAAYLSGPAVAEWLAHHCERRSGRIALKEATLKFIPVPRALADAMSPPERLAQGPGDAAAWARVAAEIPYRPRLALEALATRHDPLFHARVFVRAAQVMDSLSESQKMMLAMVTAEGKIRWEKLLGVLPRSEVVPFQVHSEVRISSSFPPNLPIAHVRKSATPMPGVLLATETGLSVHVGAGDPRLVEMLWEQFSSHSYPTWNELARAAVLPRDPEVAIATANDILRAHGEQVTRARELTELLASCQLA